MSKFIVSRGSDDQHAARLDSFIAAEEEAKERSKNPVTQTARITLANGIWLATYEAGKLAKCDMALIGRVI